MKRYIVTDTLGGEIVGEYSTHPILAPLRKKPRTSPPKRSYSRKRTTSRAERNALKATVLVTVFAGVWLGLHVNI